MKIALIISLITISFSSNAQLLNKEYRVEMVKVKGSTSCIVTDTGTVYVIENRDMISSGSWSIPSYDVLDLDKEKLSESIRSALKDKSFEDTPIVVIRVYKPIVAMRKYLYERGYPIRGDCLEPKEGFKSYQQEWIEKSLREEVARPIG